MALFNKIWRIIATGSAFTLFGLGGLILTVFVFPIVNFKYKNNEIKRKAAARYTVHRTFKFFMSYMQWVGICNLHIESEHLLEETKGKVIIANHPSLIDVVVLISLIKNADCVVKSGLWKNPFLRGVVRNTGYINNEQDTDKFIEDCKDSFKQGNNLIIFPEGTRTTPDEELRFKRGATNIAIRANADFLPVLIYVNPVTLTKGLPWYKVPEKKFTFRLLVQPPISVQKYANSDSVTNTVRQVTRELLDYYNKELKIHERVN